MSTARRCSRQCKPDSGSVSTTRATTSASCKSRRQAPSCSVEIGVGPTDAARLQMRALASRSHTGRLSTADADLPSSSYGHLVGDAAGPAQRGNRASCSGSLSSFRAPRSAPPLWRRRSGALKSTCTSARPRRRTRIPVEARRTALRVRGACYAWGAESAASTSSSEARSMRERGGLGRAHHLGARTPAALSVLSLNYGVRDSPARLRPVRLQSLSP